MPKKILIILMLLLASCTGKITKVKMVCYSGDHVILDEVFQLRKTSKGLYRGRFTNFKVINAPCVIRELGD